MWACLKWSSVIQISVPVDYKSMYKRKKTFIKLFLKVFFFFLNLKNPYYTEKKENGKMVEFRI